MAAAMGNADNRGRISLVQETIVPWSQRVNALRLAIVDAALDHATEVRNERVRRLWLVSMAITAVVTTVLVCLAVLHWRVVRPLAQLGLAIARIAAGDGSDPISLRSSTREINEMATAVETLRQAAQIAHATAMRRRQAADRRLRALRDVLGILRTVQEPARALERDLASLARGIDAALALATTSTKSPPATLSTAADSVRLGLEEMRNATADLDASIAAARVAQTRERPEDEIVAHILAAQTHASRRDEAVRGFILPSLVGLRDAATAGSEEPMLLELVRVQFQRIEAAVAMVASMRASVLQASTIVDELRQDEAPIAA
jgi:HAMP domain-containing protein